MINFKKIFPIIYAIFLISTFFYVRGIVNEEKIVVVTKKEDKIVEDVKPIKVSLTVRGHNQNSIYNVKMKNVHTFDDLLEELTKQERISYEKTEYIYGTEYDLINHERAPDGYVWKVYADDLELTYDTKGVKLVDGVKYSLILDKR